MSQLKSGIAAGVLATEINEYQTDGISDSIGKLFEILLNSNPDAAIYTLEQLSNVVTNENCDKVRSNLTKRHENIKNQVTIPEEE